MTKLIDQEEAAADEEFWGQSYWTEEANDQVYSEESSEEDVVDADFDNPENEVVEPESEGEPGKEKKVVFNIAILLIPPHVTFI